MDNILVKNFQEDKFLFSDSYFYYFYIYKIFF